MQALLLDHVQKSFGQVQAVKDLSLSIEAGTIFGLLGPNGAGKTTTIRMIMQIIMPDAGEIRLFGQPNSPEQLEKVGYLPEERGLYGKMKVGDQIIFFAELKNVPAKEAEKRARQWLQRFQMDSVWDKKLEELSKGNQQKIQFIVSILHEPQLVILDEPFTGLDPVNTQLIKDIMLEMKSSGCSIIFSTHQMDQVERLCDAICLINRGEAVLQGDLREIKRRYGRDTVILEYEGDNHFLDRLDFVKKVNDFGNYVEVHLTDGTHAQDLLKAAVQQVEVLKFELVEPSLNEIFIRTVTEE